MKGSIIFDIDGTLYWNVGECHRAGMRRSYSLLEKEMSFREFRKLYEAARSDVHRVAKGGSSHSRILYFNLMVENIRGRSVPELALRLERAYWKAYMEKMSMRKGMRETLAELGKEFMLGVASDLVARVQMMKLSRLGLSGVFSCVATSEETGKDKPDPSTILLCMRRMKAEKPRTLYVGDEKRDAEAGRRAGIRTAVFGGGGDFSLKSPKGILKVVEWMEQERS